MSQRQIGVGFHELPPGVDGQPELLEYPLYEWYTEYPPDSYMLLVVSVIMLLILVNVFATYFVWRGAILPGQDETKSETRKRTANQRRSPDSKTKRDTEDDNEYISSDDGEFMTLEELQRRQSR
ncbi:MAG: hypothetical protein MUF38_16090 [Anaerolineae bacterium]|nr:hypothetical protein [Anaerolineae bacterium]